MTDWALYYSAIRAGCLPVHRAGIVKGVFAFAYHCECDEVNHGDKARLITPESLTRGPNKN